MPSSQMPVKGPDYLKLPRQPNLWIVEPLLPMGGSMLIYGKPKVGKSLASLQLASAIGDSSKGDFCGFPIHQHGPVLYLQLDTSRGIWTADMENGISDLELNFDNVIFADKEMVPRPFDARTTGSDYIKACMNVFAPIVVIVDTTRKTHDGDEDNSGQMKQILESLSLATAPAALVLVSHARKGNPDYEDLMNDIRGSTYTAGEVDLVMRVSKKRFTYEGRAIEERRLDLARTKHGFWKIDNQDVQQKLFAFLAKPEHKDLTTLALSELFAKEVGCSVEAARSRIRKVKGS